jgi:hypothetical protein
MASRICVCLWALVLGSLALTEPASYDRPSGRLNYTKLDYLACDLAAEWLGRIWYGSQGSKIGLSATAEGSLSGEYTSRFDNVVFTLAGRFTCGGNRPPTVALAVACKNDLNGSWNVSMAWTGWLRGDCSEAGGALHSSCVLHTGWIFTHVIGDGLVTMKSGKDDYRPDRTQSS